MHNSSNNDARQKLLDLDKKRAEIEKEILNLNNKLNSKEMGFVGMSKSLVDKEGFPLSDVDIYSVRAARNKVICLNNDLKQLMVEIERGLIEYHKSNAN